MALVKCSLDALLADLKGLKNRRLGTSGINESFDSVNFAILFDCFFEITSFRPGT